MIAALLSIFFVLVCLLLIFMVVITPSQEGGLASAFGGMGSDSFFGTKAHRHINRFTVFLAVAFVLIAMVINWRNARAGVSPEEKKSIITEGAKETPAPPPAPPPSNP